MTIIVRHKGRETALEGEGFRSLDEMLSHNGIDIYAPCGGRKKCGKCFVLIHNISAPPSEEEIQLLGQQKIREGYRLSCFVKPADGMVVTSDEDSKKNQILTIANIQSSDPDPVFRIVQTSIPAPSLTNQSSHLRSIREVTGRETPSGDIRLLRELDNKLQTSGFAPFFFLYRDRIVGMDSGGGQVFHGIAVDIGTTTVAAYLFRLPEGAWIDVVSDINKQRSFGSDIISRIQRASESRDALESIHMAIVGQINRMIQDLASRNQIPVRNIFLVVLAGNTTMMHLFMGINPEHIGKSPFTPVTVDLHEFPAEFTGVTIHPRGYIVCLPSISGYIGADVVAGVLATGIHKGKNPSVLLDIGTNGEVVLGNCHRMVSCSTAAGPAFEGASIRFGTGGVEGAIDSVSFDSGDISYTTIHKKPPIGICGSGVIDLTAELLRHGMISETGRFNEKEDLPTRSPLTERMVTFEGKPAFRITDDLYFTQKDIREVQNAKAAVIAGLRILARRYPADWKDIDSLFLAGGFGNFININNAACIGLIPQGLKDKVVSAGNTSGAGASLCLLNREFLDEAVTVANSMEYVELSSDPEFTEEYIRCLTFETSAF